MLRVQILHLLFELHPPLYCTLPMYCTDIMQGGIYTLVRGNKSKELPKSINFSISLHNVCAVHQEVCSTPGDFSTLGDIMSTVGDIMSTPGDIVSTLGAYRDECGGYHEYTGGCSVHLGNHE